MADIYSVDAQTRTIFGKKVSQLRKQKLVPGVIYGAGGVPTHISVPYRPLEIVLSKAGGTHVINVVVDGTVHNTIVREVQRHSIRRELQHVDFMRVDMNKKLRLETALRFIKQPKLSSELQLQENLQAIEIECFPINIPDHIEIDISKLTTLGAQITVADLPVLEGVEYLADPTEVIIRIAGLSAEDGADAEATIAEPEVMEKGKKQEEDF